jgi:S1-C subfamily serine protease
VTPELKSANNLSVDYGVIVKGDGAKNQLAVIPGSPADKAGIVENDIILEVGGVKIDGDTDFAQMIRGRKVGDALLLTILSKGTQKKVTVVLETAPQD